jgi:Tfp pilus assembly PilM family ATPase
MLVAVDAEPLAMFRAFHRLHRRDTDKYAPSAVIRVGSTSTLVLVEHQGRILFVKNIERGADRMTAAAAHQLGLSFDETAQLRLQIMSQHTAWLSERRNMHSAGGTPPQWDSMIWTLHDAMRDETNALVLEIDLCLKYCSSTFGCPKVGNAYLCGDWAWDPSVIHLLCENSGVRCDGVRPFRTVDTSNCPVLGDRRSALSDWTLCVGLACWSMVERRGHAGAGFACLDPVEMCLEGSG